MRVFLVILSIMFLVSAMNDCCLADIEQEVASSLDISHSEESHSSETEACEQCQCSNFCSYNIVIVTLDFEFSKPNSYLQTQNFISKHEKEIQISQSIFHPPIA